MWGMIDFTVPIFQVLNFIPASFAKEQACGFDTLNAFLKPVPCQQYMLCHGSPSNPFSSI